MEVLCVAAQFVASGALDWALSETETAVALAPEMIDTHTACAYLFARSGRLDEARAEFGKAVALARAVDDPTFRRRSLISLLGKNM